LTKIYYFSGTGNSLWSAQRIAEIIGDSCELFNIGIEAQKPEIIIEADTVVLVFPSYAYGLPLIVSRFVKNASIKAPYVAAFVTYGTSPGGTLAALSHILKKKKLAATFFGRIPAVENYLALFGPPKAHIVESRVAMQQEATEEAARCIIERRENRVFGFRPFSVLIYSLFFIAVHFFYKWYHLSADCNGCGRCVKMCPVSAIIMQDKRPIFTKRCEHCQGCLNICPMRAIHFGRVTKKTSGYYHPWVKR
jgi:ferredoxin